MTVRIVRLGSPRAPDEGPRIGTVRRPPRGVPRSEFSSGDWYDTWYPELSPSPPTIRLAHAARTAADWQAFHRQYRAEMAAPAARRTIELLAVLSRGANFSVGCYCEDEAHCHRSTLRELLKDCGADIAGPTRDRSG